MPSTPNPTPPSPPPHPGQGPDREGRLWLMIDNRAAVNASRAHGADAVARVIISNVRRREGAGGRAAAPGGERGAPEGLRAPPRPRTARFASARPHPPALKRNPTPTPQKRSSTAAACSCRSMAASTPSTSS
jgi:hypothetical protein